MDKSHLINLLKQDYHPDIDWEEVIKLILPLANPQENIAFDVVADANRYRLLKSRAYVEDRDGGWLGAYHFFPVHKYDHTPYAKKNGGFCDYKSLDEAVDALITQMKGGG